jgi:C-terminal processing protease CtpA/Prc
MQVPKHSLLVSCLILSFIIHYVSIWSIPDLSKKFNPDLTEIEFLDKKNDLNEEKKSEIKDKVQLEKILDQERKQSLIDQQNSVKEMQAIQVMVKEQFKRSKGGAEVSKILAEYENKYHPLKGKLAFKSFAENMGDTQEICSDKNTYAGVGAEFDIITKIDPATKIESKIIDQRRIDNVTYVKIHSIKPNSPLQKAGVKPGDLIEYRVQDITSKPLGTQITVALISNNKKQVIQLRSEVICFH